MEQPRQRRRWLPITIVLTLTVLLIGGAAYTLLDVRGRWMLDEEIAQWKKIGGSDDLSDFKPIPVHDDDNAMHLYEQAFAALPVWDEDSPEFAMDEEGVLIPLSDDIRMIVEQAQPALALLHKAAKLPECQWPADYSAGAEAWIGMHMSYLGNTRALTRYALPAAQVALAEGRHDKAMQLLADCLILADHVGRNDTVLGLLVQTSIEARMFDFLEQLLRNTDVDCRALLPLLERSFLRKRLIRAMLIECAGWVDDFQSGAWKDKTHGKLPLLKYRFLARVLRVYRMRLQEAMLPMWEQATATPYQPTEEEQDAVNRFPVGMGVGRANTFVARAEAYRAVFRLAVSLRAYRAEHGQYPDKLSDATVPAPIDPFTGEPMLYELVPEGFIISVPHIDWPIEWRWK